MCLHTNMVPVTNDTNDTNDIDVPLQHAVTSSHLKQIIV